MLLSQDIHQPRDNSDALWNQLCYTETAYKPNRIQRGKDSKDSEAKSTIEEYVEHVRQLP
ncbi:uncharacterized protein LOC143354566 [Halictus rubicundus]|uniref:uncharacterized protein LOC143354566 n=1 Tax=Halictus rubicundus TaxID=77578 RepID=UPI00403650AE